MASPKRASMREGPLAALFRGTEDRERRDPAPAAEPGAEGEGDTAGVAEAGIAEGGPARRSMPEAWPGDEPLGLPSAEERLAQVFSADIPENIMDRFSGRGDAAALAVPQPVQHPNIRVVGVGGAGVNAVNRMVEAGLDGVEFVAVNTDVQSLEGSSADESIRIGGDLTGGLGSGSDSDIGRRAAMEDYDRLKGRLKGSDMVFVAAGAGGGTGTGAAPVVARIAREVGALCVGIVTKPFPFEGSRRKTQAEAGVDALAREVDTLIVIPNARLLTVLDRRTSMVDAFRAADDVLRQGVQGISDLITLPGLINLDFADVRTIMTQAGTALLGIGMGVGERRAVDAAERAVSSPLLETSVEGARSILLSITGGSDLSLWEVNEAAKAVAEAAYPDANIIFGAMVDDKVDDQVWVTVVATGYGDKPLVSAAPAGEHETSDGAVEATADRARDLSPGASPDPLPAPARAPGRDRARGPDEKRAKISAGDAGREPFVVPPGSAEDLPSPDDLEVPEFIPRR